MAAVDEFCLNAVNVEDDKICIVIRRDPLGYSKLLVPLTRKMFCSEPLELREGCWTLS